MSVLNRRGPYRKFAYVVNSGCSDFIPAMSTYTISATTGALTSTGTVAADFCPHSVTVDPFGKFAYVANYGSYCGYTSVLTDGSVSMYTISTTTGALTSIGSPVEAGSRANSVAVDPTTHVRSLGSI